ncbi:MAG: IS1182 family transposase [Phycisphaerae bacterium]|nr:IS1182 family transposase [Phycisphaerae bacterium]NIV98326.1 IS1182 family transposase [Candidatus Saccharibacteria bacterium]
MAKFKRYDYSQKVLIPVSLEEQLVPGSLEFAIHTLIETRMDMSVFEGKYKNDVTGRSAYDPKVLLKVVLLGYARGLISSRQIERACCENVTFMALSGNQRPDHSTIATFVSSMKDQILPLFCDILLVCEQENLLGGTFFALDGLKLPANASKESSGTISELTKKKDKIQQKVKRLLKDQIEADKDDDDDFRPPATREQQIDKLKKQADRIEKWLKKNNAKISSNGTELKSNLTDNDSALMLTSQGTIQGYNGQALVDDKHQIIVHGEAFGSGQDAKHLEPMVDGAKANLEKIGERADYFKGKILTADTNYHNQGNLKKCHDEQIDAYIPDLKFRNRDSRFATRPRNKPKKRKKFVLGDFKYNPAADHYICPNGKILNLDVKKHIRDHNIYRRYMADENDCACCSLTHRCFYRKNTKRRSLDVPIGAASTNFSKAMQNKVDSDKGRKIYPQRFAIVEPVFANIKTQKRLNRFTLRGKVKVNIQWMLYCMVHNIEKIMNFAVA